MNQCKRSNRALRVLVASIAALACSSPASQAQQQTWPPPVPEKGFYEPSPGWPPAVVNVTRPLPGRGFKLGHVDVDGWRINYIEGGKGPTTLVAFSGSMGMAPSSAKDILAREYRVIEINPPGWGADELNTRMRDMRDMAPVYLKVLDKLGVKQFHALGISMGCTHALWAAKFAPERVLSITVEGGQCMALSEGPDTQRAQTPRQVEAQKAAQAGGPFNADYSIWTGWPGYAWAPEMWWQTPSYQSRAMYRRYVKNFPYNRNVHRDELLASLKDVKVPVTEMIGDRDEIMTTGVSYYWKKHMPQAKFVIVAGAIHNIEDSQPEQFVEIIKACSIERLVDGLMCPGD